MVQASSKPCWILSLGSKIKLLRNCWIGSTVCEHRHLANKENQVCWGLKQKESPPGNLTLLQISTLLLKLLLPHSGAQSTRQCYKVAHGQNPCVWAGMLCYTHDSFLETQILIVRSYPTVSAEWQKRAQRHGMPHS